VFAESIENKRSFTGCRCDGWSDFLEGKCSCSSRENIASMGEPCSKNTNGKYYLITKSVQPFGMGLKGSKSLRLYTSNNATASGSGMRGVPVIRNSTLRQNQAILTHSSTTSSTMRTVSISTSSSSSREYSAASSSTLAVLAINTSPIFLLLFSLAIYCACRKY